MNIAEPHYIDIFPEEFRKEAKTYKPILEMACDLNTYRDHLRAKGGVIFRHIIYVCALGNKLPGYVKHWKDEIREFASYAIDMKVKGKSKNFDRSLHVQREIMGYHMGEKFEDYDEEEFITALDDEVRKGKYMLRDATTPAERKQIQNAMEITKHVRKHAVEVADMCKGEIVSFYDKYLESARQNSSELLYRAVDELKPVVPEDF